jgi:N12 class adenine-specific DNA methylase
MQGGQPVPVVYGGQPLKAGGTMTGRRLAALIGLRDRARRVLQSQNEGWPEADRQEARRELNRAYDHFAFTYGPVNKTTFSETADGTVVRRMPNVVKFREDPDAMLVMALEDYDEMTGTAAKAPIMSRDVVGRNEPVTKVATAEEGLLVSLNQRGAVDLPFIAGLYGKPEEQVIAELGDLIYRDPQTSTWQTADAYLSANVRAKLAAAEAAGPDYARNAEALRVVQPEDVLPGEIDANLGAPWIPEADIQSFAAELFGVPADSIQIGHLKKDAVWSVDAGYAAEQSVAAKSEFGTTRANGVWLLELALNMKSPVIYDPDPADADKRVVNPEATLAAKEKQKAIKERFRTWVFADPDRTERLVRIYNDTYNNLRPRLFDGSHLDFPGMSQGIALRQHQKDAVWRGTSGGNTLLAHAVGAGKTFTMAAAGMKMKQAGLIKKPLYVVPNHLLEQFAREFQQLYPNARLLVAGKEDFTRDRRKFLTAKIASGDWDGIIVTHSSFERIGMSRDYQERFLREQIAEYEQLLTDGASRDAKRTCRNLIKTIEKQKAAREAKLKDLLAGDKKDDGLVFDELGVDHLFIDEAHTFNESCSQCSDVGQGLRHLEVFPTTAFYTIGPELGHEFLCLGGLARGVVSQEGKAGSYQCRGRRPTSADVSCPLRLPNKHTAGERVVRGDTRSNLLSSSRAASCGLPSTPTPVPKPTIRSAGTDASAPDAETPGCHPGADSPSVARSSSGTRANRTGNGTLPRSNAPRSDHRTARPFGVPAGGRRALGSRSSARTA